MNRNILQIVNSYYSEKIEMFGASPKGVDWNNLEDQKLRFDKLIESIDLSKIRSILDYGCGYGAFLYYLIENDWEGTYYGFDISEEMILTAKNEALKNGVEIDTYFSDQLVNAKYDLVIANGVFNVKLGVDLNDWVKYVEEINLAILNLSPRFYCLNFLTEYSDEDRKTDKLYYASISHWINYFNTCRPRQIKLLHNYKLYEFTLQIGG